MADKIPYQNVQQVAFDFWAKPVLQDSNGAYYCPGFDGPTYAKNPWDFIQFGTASTAPAGAFGPSSFTSKTPGLCIVDSERFRDVDKKKAAGSDGGRITIHGVEPAEVSIEILIWTPEQLRQLQSLWAILNPSATKGSPPAYDAYHPQLAMHGIKSLIFVRGSGPKIDEKRVGHFTIKAWEYLPPAKKNAVKTETKSKGNLYDPNAASGTPSNTSAPASYPTPGSTKANANP